MLFKWFKSDKNVCSTNIVHCKPTFVNTFDIKLDN